MEAGTLLFERSLASLIVTESVIVFKSRIYHCIGERQVPPKGERIKDTWSLRLHGSRYATFRKVTSISESVTVFKTMIYHYIGERQVPPKGEQIKDIMVTMPP